MHMLYEKTIEREVVMCIISSNEKFNVLFLVDKGKIQSSLVAF